MADGARSEGTSARPGSASSDSKWVTRAAGALAVGRALGFGLLTWLDGPRPTPDWLLVPGLLSMFAFPSRHSWV